MIRIDFKKISMDFKKRIIDVTKNRYWFGVCWWSWCRAHKDGHVMHNHTCDDCRIGVWNRWYDGKKRPLWRFGKVGPPYV